MKKLFVVSTNPTTADQDKVFIQWVDGKFSWWHWLNDTWLLTDSYGVYSAENIRDKAKECFPQIHLIVLEFSQSGSTWSGFGPSNKTDAAKNMFAWVRNNWTLN